MSPEHQAGNVASWEALLASIEKDPMEAFGLLGRLWRGDSLGRGFRLGCTVIFARAEG